MSTPVTQADHIAALNAHHAWPDYPAEDLPLIPPGFEFDWSGMFPLFSSDELGLGIVVEYLDPARRFATDQPRFNLFQNGEEGDCPTDLLWTDNWNAVLAHIDARRTAERARP